MLTKLQMSYSRHLSSCLIWVEYGNKWLVISDQGEMYAIHACRCIGKTFLVHK